MHDEEHNALKAAKDGKQVRWDYCVLKLEATKDPHGAQQTQLSHCSDGERPAGGNKDTHRLIWGTLTRVAYILGKNILY